MKTSTLSAAFALLTAGISLHATVSPEEVANTIILNDAGVKNLRIETVEVEETDDQEVEESDDTGTGEDSEEENVPFDDAAGLDEDEDDLDEVQEA